MGAMVGLIIIGLIYTFIEGSVGGVIFFLVFLIGIVAIYLCCGGGQSSGNMPPTKNVDEKYQKMIKDRDQGIYEGRPGYGADVDLWNHSDKK